MTESEGRNGPGPPGPGVGFHQCRTPGCVGRSGDVSPYCVPCSRRMRAAKTPKGSRGGRGPGVRAFTDDEIREVRRMHAGFKSAEEIAERFGVTTRTVRRYLK